MGALSFLGENTESGSVLGGAVSLGKVWRKRLAAFGPFVGGALAATVLGLCVYVRACVSECVSVSMDVYYF